ncbi:hypothetical protein E9840_09960 [Tissierella creatinini]|nr:hypothetical protein E9840_09960 [Tissierella creatinini]TJX64411.1 hypothetical protein E8P77_12200 [Soehngenia saccharolytica]
MEFIVDNENNLKYKKLNSVIILDENVSISGFTIDKDSSIHLVYLQKNGALNYIIFKDDKMIKSIIGNFDTKSNTYNQIEILIVNNQINLFYSYSNIINANIYTIHHIVINDKNQEKFNVIRYVSKKKERSFSVSSDSIGNIHLLYNTVSENFSYIYYTYFNPYKNQWLNSPSKLSSIESYNEYPTMYVDSKDNIHCIYWEYKNNTYYLRIKRMTQGGRDMYKWNNIQIPKVIEDIPKLEIHEINNLLTINTDNIKLVSMDYGMTYSEDLSIEKLDIKVRRKNECEEDESIVETNNSEDKVNLEPLIHELKVSYDELKEINNENKTILEQLILNEDDIKLKLHGILDELASINSRVNGLEEAIKNSKSGFRSFFS